MRFASPPLPFQTSLPGRTISRTTAVKPASTKTPGSAAKQAGLTAIASLFFCSGAIALVYEVLWQRQFALLLGSAAPASAAVLAAYFAGLGAGSFVVGRLAHRWASPLRAYAVLEVLIGAGALLTVLIQLGFDRFYPLLFGALADKPGTFFAVKLAMAFAAIAVPTFCMGGTLPLLGRFADQGRQHLGLTAGLLYVANTAGASLGALSVPFVLLPLLGINNTLALCVVGNLALAVWAWWLAKRFAPVPLPSPVGSDRKISAPRRAHGLNSTYALALLSGAATFALQVFWNRAFAQVHENSVHSFAVIVAVVILALAMGAQLARVGLGRGLPPRALLAASWCAAGVLILAGPWLFLRLTGGLAYFSTQLSFFTYAGKLLSTTAAVLFIPIALLGVGLPALMEEAGRDTRRGASEILGRLLAVNVIGSVAGSLIAGFLAPHWLGLWTGILMIGLLLAFAGLAAWLGRNSSSPRNGRMLALATAFAMGCWLAARLELPRVRLDSARGERLVSIAEGSHGITAVIERPGSRRLKLNNHYVLGGTASTGDERMQAHLPLLLHPAPRRVAFLGVGTGITAGGALFHPVEQVVAIELVPEVITAARAQFSEANAGLLTDPRTKVVVDDARNYLRGSGDKFDVIVGDLVVPWRQGEGALFTAESFVAARAALAPGGLFCQWLPLFQLSATEARMVIHTFRSVFPNATLWRGDFSPTEPAIALIGGAGEMKLQSESLRSRIAQLKPDPTNPQLADPVIFWMHYVGALQPAEAGSAPGPINTDDRPVIELMGPLQRGQPGHAWLNGRGLQTLLDTLTGGGAGNLARLTVEENAGAQAGRVLAQMAIELSERNPVAARAAQQQLQQLLPDASFKLLFP